MLRLLQAAEDYIASLYPPESRYAEPLDSLALPHVAVFCAGVPGEWLACCALKHMQDPEAYGEIKRLFVAPGARGLGLAKQLMAHIEAHALAEGIRVLRLETGISQPEALGLYRSLGYATRGPFGAYPSDPPDPFSVFLEKRLP